MSTNRGVDGGRGASITCIIGCTNNIVASRGSSGGTIGAIRNEDSEDDF